MSTFTITPIEGEDPDQRARREQMEIRLQKRAERMKEIVMKFLRYHCECAGDKAKMLESWRVFLEEVDRKVNILKWISPSDIWRAIGTLPENDKISLAAIYTTITEKTFPKNFDEKLTYLRRVIGFAAAGHQYRVGVAASTSAAGGGGTGANALAGEGMTPDELRQAGFLVREMLDAGYTPKDLMKANYSIDELKMAGISAEQLVKSGCKPTADLARKLKSVGYSCFDLAITDSFSADQLLFAGYPRGDILKQGLTFNYPPKHMIINEGRGSRPASRTATRSARTSRHIANQQVGAASKRSLHHSKSNKPAPQLMVPAPPTPAPQ